MMAPEEAKQAQRKQFEKAIKRLRDLGPSILDAASYAEETYLASDRPDVELANAQEYIASTIASVAEHLAAAAERLAEGVRLESEETLATAEFQLAACTQQAEALQMQQETVAATSRSGPLTPTQKNKESLGADPTSVKGTTAQKAQSRQRTRTAGGSQLSNPALTLDQSLGRLSGIPSEHPGAPALANQNGPVVGANELAEGRASLSSGVSNNGLNGHGPAATTTTLPPNGGALRVKIPNPVDGNAIQARLAAGAAAAAGAGIGVAPQVTDSLAYSSEGYYGQWDDTEAESCGTEDYYRGDETEDDESVASRGASRPDTWQSPFPRAPSEKRGMGSRKRSILKRAMNKLKSSSQEQ